MRTLSTLGTLTLLTIALLAGCSDSASSGDPSGSDPDAGHHGSGGGAGGGGGADGVGGGVGGGGGDSISDGGMTDDPPDSGTMEPDPPQPEGFVHPGILVNEAMLAFVKGKIDANAQPWKGAFDHADSSWFADLGYTPHPRETVECGSYSNPDIGCSDEKNDCVAAYTHALLWYHTGDEAHAEKAIEIMNAWSYTIRSHTNSNAPLQSAWVAEVFPRAAEIIRYTYSGWSEDDIEQFETMLTDVYLPQVIDGSGSNGNWELSMIEAAMNIGVFTDDQEVFDKAVAMWRERVPAYIYMTSDGPNPVPSPRGDAWWYGANQYIDGLSQETCRDMGHVEYGFAAMINAAETARIQGVDLYGEEQDRIRHGLGLHAAILNGQNYGYLCPDGYIKDANPDSDNHGMWEIGFNHYSTTLGYAMTQTEALTLSIRPTGASHHMVWETLTHGDIGGVGLP
jgi:hypothetical protein